MVRDAAPSHSGYGTPGHWAISGSATGTPGSADADFATTFVGWRWDYFSKAEVTLPDGNENTVFAGAAADADLDGMNNFGEYAFGTDPRAPSGAGIVETGVIITGADTYATASFTRPRKPLDLKYEVQFSGDLAAWNTSGQELSRIGIPGTELEKVTFRDMVPLGNERRFARVSAKAIP